MDGIILVFFAILLLPPVLAGWLLYTFWQLSRRITDEDAWPTGGQWAGLLALATLACLVLVAWAEFITSLSSLTGPAHNSLSSWRKEENFYSTLTNLWLLGTGFALVLLARFRRWRVAGCFAGGGLLVLAAAVGGWRYQHPAQRADYVTLATDELPSSAPLAGGRPAAAADSVQQRKLAGTVFDVSQVAQGPTFPGGAPALGEAIWAQRRLPAKAENRVAGKVVVEFVVEADGRVALPHVTAGLGAAYDAEAVRIIRNLCCFAPGVRQGRPVAVVWACAVPFD